MYIIIDNFQPGNNSNFKIFCNSNSIPFSKAGTSCLQWDKYNPYDKYKVTDIEIDHLVTVSIDYGSQYTTSYNLTDVTCKSVTLNSSILEGSYICTSNSSIPTNKAFGMRSTDDSLVRSGKDWTVTMIVNADRIILYYLNNINL